MHRDSKATPILQPGTRAYLDAFLSGLVPCEVVSIACTTPAFDDAPGRA